MCDIDFVKAESDNLAKVDSLKIAEYFASNKKYMSAEIQQKRDQGINDYFDEKYRLGRALN